MKLNSNINYFEMYDSPFQDFVKKYLKGAGNIQLDRIFDYDRFDACLASQQK